VEPELVGGALELGELVWMPVANDRQMALGGAQVLPDRQHLNAALSKRPEGIDHLLKSLAEPHHQPGLGDDLALAELAGEPQHAAGARELGPAPCERVKAGDDLDVVVKDV